jgi:hypothetical protein
MRRRRAHGTRETAHGVAGTAPSGSPSTFRWASWADWADAGVEESLACKDLPVWHVNPSCHGDAPGPVSASRDRTEGLGDVTRDSDPSGGTGRLKSSRPDQFQLFPVGVAEYPRVLVWTRLHGDQFGAADIERRVACDQ